MQTKSHLQMYGQLFVDLHLSGRWSDGKLISDAVPLSDPDIIVEKYKASKSDPSFDLGVFFETHFELRKPSESSFSSDMTKSAEEHIYALWEFLQRPADKEVKGSSLVSMPYPYVVPGGRFNEIYYWDSYFTMLGLSIHGKEELIESMVDNFAWMIEKFGFIPNGNRTYFMGRSQPPFFAQMVEHLASIKGLPVLSKCKKAMVQEYAFWMDHATDDSQRKIAMVDGGVLNRYFDRYSSPREEMYRDDVELLSNSNRSEEDLFSNIRAACESGWDFSSRWFKDFENLSTIRCSDVLPIDLNCLLYSLETLLSKTYALENDMEGSKMYMEKAESRRLLIQKLMWNPSLVFFTDYDYVQNASINHLNLAGVFPLYFKLATDDQANKVMRCLQEVFLKPGGLTTTTINSGQQWDAPNGWAPLQWIAVIGLDNYGYKELAREVASRWVSLNERVYKSSGKFVEKYNVEDMSLKAGGGEYPVQDGFGWSNGVYLAMKNYLDSEESL